MRTELKRLHQRVRTTSVYVTHDQVEAMTMGDRIVVMNGGVIRQVGTPFEIYDRPANVFVAGFMGSPPMNFFPGRLEANGGAASVRLNGDVRLKLARPDLAASPSRDVILGIRPEHISLSSDVLPVSDTTVRSVRAPASVLAEIEVVEPLGHRVLVTARSAAGVFQLETELHESLKPASHATLFFDMSRAHLFDAASELAF